MGLGRELDLARRLADAADVITTRWFLSEGLSVESKPDHTPVTAADRSVEQEWRAVLARERPEHDVLGEEMGGSSFTGSDRPREWRWVLDPIDGTKNFIRGVPVWASLIGLEHRGVPVVGVVSAPALHRRWWACSGAGAWESDRRLRVSEVGQVGDAFFSYDSLDRFPDPQQGQRWMRFARSCARTRGLGDFWSHMLVAEGAVDVAAEPEVAHWDMAAVKVIVEEAGGRFTDLNGRSRPDGGSALSTNGLLHEQVLAALGIAGGDDVGGDGAGGI